MAAPLASSRRNDPKLTRAPRLPHPDEADQRIDYQSDMTALQSLYEQALARPNADAFSPGASIHYVPTLTSIHGGSAIVKHLQTQDTLLRASHKALNVIESTRSLCIEAETRITFLEGAGAYLPGLDDNFTTDRSAIFPTVHIVSFDSDNKILQIRTFWDQASLLKSVEVIGARANQWPIRDSQEQIRLVTSSVSRQQAPSESNTRRQSRAGANGDPHTSLHLFEKPQTQPREPSPHHNVAPRESAKPAPRDYHDLFAAGVEGQAADERPASPIKEYHNAIKSGAGKNYQPIRLFDEADEDALKSPERGIKTNPAKYSHFEFGEAPFEPKEVKLKHTKHQSQWAFEDFSTPQKPKARPTSYHPATQDRHFGWSDDEEEAAKPNTFVQHVPAPRPDAKAHIDFNDDAAPQVQAAADIPIRGSSQRAQGLYEDHVTDNDGQPSKEPLGNITNEATKASHMKNFSSQFEILDDSTGNDENAGLAEQKTAQKKPEANVRASKTLQPQWEMTDESPGAGGISTNIAGDGMGSRKTAEKSWWEYDE